MATLLSTTSFGYDNFYRSQLTSDVTDSATDIFLDLIPTASEGTLIIDPDSSANREIIFYSSKTGTKVVTPANGRGYDNTTAVPHTAGTAVIMAPIADWFASIQTGQVLDDNSITTAKILDDAVTAPKLVGIDRSNLTTDSNPYKFSAYVTANYATAGGFVFTKVTLNAETFDTNSNFDSATNYRYTAPVAGFYYLTGACSLFLANTVLAQCAIYKNGAAVKTGLFIQNLTGGNNTVTTSVSGLVSLAATDYVELFVAHNAGGTGTLNGGATVSYLDGYLVSRT